MITEWRIILRPGGPSRETMAQPRTLVRLPADGLLNLGQSGSLTRLANARIWAPLLSARGAAALFARAAFAFAFDFFFGGNFVLPSRRFRALRRSLL